MKKILFLVFSFILISTMAEAQLQKLRRYELTFGTGATQFFGDIGGYSKGKNMGGLKDFSFRNSSYNADLNFKYRIREDITARLSLDFGAFHSNDGIGSNEKRGFESSTLFFEPAILGEYHFIQNIGYYLMTSGEKISFRSILDFFDVYVFAGFGGLQYNVKPNDNLAPRATKTTGFTAVIPGGIGLNLNYSRYVSFGLEYGVRYVFSDNIDGYASDFSRYNDQYQILNFTFTYKFR
jgi:hypothetical protein